MHRYTGPGPGRGRQPTLLWLVLGRALRLCAVVAVAVALAPVTLTAAVAYAFGWWRGWPPRRVYMGALWCVPMVVAWLVTVAVWPVPTGDTAPAGARHVSWPAGLGPGPFWWRLVAAPYRAWFSMWQLAAHGHAIAALVAIAAPAIPLGILAGGRAWAIRISRMETGSGGRSPASAAAFDAGLWRRQVRAAKAVIAAPGSLPLLSRGARFSGEYGRSSGEYCVVTGAVIRAVRHRPAGGGHGAAAIPAERLRSHQVVIGSTGTGKTTLLLRLWAGFMAAGMRRYAAGEASRPLLVVIDCKGGASSRKVADRARRVLRDAGAAGTAIWPDEASLSLWSLPPDTLITTLLDLIEHGTGGAAYYSDIMESFVELAVKAPGGPPVNAADFLGRLNAGWLDAAYASAGGTGIGTGRSGKNSPLDDVALRFRALWRRLGAGLDSADLGRGGGFADYDAWYCVLEGTAEQSVAEAQARALTDLLASFAVESRREILLAVDEYSAVSRRLPIWRLQERARSLGMAIQVSAQSWEGLADSEDERRRVAGTAEGGIWLLRVPRPEPVAELAGTRSVVDTSRQLGGPGAWEETGSSRARLVPVLDGDLVRRLDVGQAAYVYRGGVTYVQVKRLTGRQAAIDAAPVPEAPVPEAAVPEAAVPEQRAAAPTVGQSAPPGARPAAVGLPDVSEVLDEAFGARRA